MATTANAKHVHEAAAYDTWFRDKVQEALDDPRQSIPNEQVMAAFAERRLALRQRAGVK